MAVLDPRRHESPLVPRKFYASSRSAAPRSAGKTSAPQNNRPRAPASSALISSSSSPALTAHLSSRRPVAGHWIATAHRRDYTPRTSTAVAPEQRPSPPSTFHLFSPFLPAAFLDGRSTAAFPSPCSVAQYYSSTSSLSARAFALSRAATRTSRPCHTRTLSATARRPPPWVFPLCSAGSARNTPRSCPL